MWVGVVSGEAQPISGWGRSSPGYWRHIVSIHLYQVHIRLVKILSGNISVMDFYPMAVLPFFLLLVITFVGCADAFGKQIPFFVFPAVLQQ